MVNYEFLVKELVKYEKETPWVEFKENKADPQEIAERKAAWPTVPRCTGVNMDTWFGE